MTLYLSGSVRPNLPEGVGVMVTPMMGNKLPEDRVFAIDTGCFARPDKYSDEWYFSYLDKLSHATDRCLFATAPDVWGDGIATLKKSRSVLPEIRRRGYKAALVVQPGIGVDQIPWDELDAVFVGGPNLWQRSEAVMAILREAMMRGKWKHQGRVNGCGRFRSARVTGYDSADGTYIAFGPDILIPRVQRWVDHVSAQPTLFTMTGEGYE